MYFSCHTYAGSVSLFGFRLSPEPALRTGVVRLFWGGPSTKMKLFASSPSNAAVEVGSHFERVLDSGAIENAEVRDISTLTDGIKHVRFRACYERSGSSQNLGEKILSIESFAGRYKACS